MVETFAVEEICQKFLSSHAGKQSIQCTLEHNVLL